VTVVWDDEFLSYDLGPEHPLNPVRLALTMSLSRQLGVLDRPNVTTVTGTRGNGTVLDDHSLDDAYVPLAGDAQASDDRSVRDFLGSADGYFRAVSVQTHAYDVRRAY